MEAGVVVTMLPTINAVTIVVRPRGEVAEVTQTRGSILALGTTLGIVMEHTSMVIASVARAADVT